jgi:hypothetical protein
VIVVEEEEEQPDVFARGLGLLVVPVADLARRQFAGPHVAVDLDEPELLDRLRLLVLEHLEVGLREVGHRLLLAVGDDHVHAHEVDGFAERRRLLWFLWLRLCLRRLCLLLSLRFLRRPDLECRREDHENAGEGMAAQVHVYPTFIDDRRKTGLRSPVFGLRWN